MEITNIRSKNKKVIIPITKINMPSQKFNSFTQYTKSQEFYKANFKSFYPVTSAFAMILDKTQGQTLPDGVILALVYRNGIKTFIDYKKLFIALTRIKEVSHLRFLADIYKNIFYLTILIPKKYISTFIEIMKKKQ